MTSILDASVGTSTANAYCTAVEADTYLIFNRGFTEDWVDASIESKEAAIIWSTRQLDELEWEGTKTSFSGSQALRWPRFGLTDRDGEIISGSTIPKFLKNATAEWAFALITEDRTKDEGGLVEYGSKVGPITNPHTYARKTMPDSVKDIIEPYIAFKRGYGRVSRV